MLAAEPHTAPEELMSRLDSAVSEVFETMLERSCAPVASQHAAGEHITAQIELRSHRGPLCRLRHTASGATHRRGPPRPRLRSPRPNGRRRHRRVVQHDRRRLEEQTRHISSCLSYLRPHHHPRRFRQIQRRSPHHDNLQPLILPSRTTSSELSWASENRTSQNSFTLR